MKILMALMGLNIGGAETHVVELSKELKKMGNTIIVVSAGGAYQQEIEAAGIKHYYAPLLTHKLGDMTKAYGILKRVISVEKPDVVHAHARIPALLCHIIHKFNKSFSFVTSVHYMFNTKGLMGKLSRWGSRQLAVSEDLKRYVIQNYKGIKEENVSVSVNGIDTEKFSSSVDGSSVVSEFGLKEGSTRIVYVSRLDKEVCTPIYSVLKIFPRLIEQIPDLEIVIVGQGTGFDELSAMANDINKITGRRAVVLTGARTDIAKINACATFCIGVSRSILEAMAESKPVILAGNFGYMGVFGEHNLATAISNNFTCRSTSDLDEDKLFEDIMQIYNMEKSDFDALGEYCRAVVEEYYSATKMALDNLRMYKSIVYEGKYDAAILGYYGYHNSGDDALLHSIINSLKERKSDVRIAVFSKNPEETSKLYNITSISRFNFFRMRKALKNTKLFIMGGGSLLQDGTSRRSLAYYIACLKLAKRKCEKTMLYANGVGPFVHKFSKRKVANALKNVDLITLRDDDSAEELKKIGVTQNVYVTADPAFSLTPGDNSGLQELEKRGVDKSDKFVCISPRKWNRQSENFIEEFAGMCDYIVSEYGYKVVFIPMQYPYDAKIIRQIQATMKNPAVFVDKRLAPGEILSIIGQSELTIGVRLHILIYASAMAVPAIGIVYDPKVSSFQRYINQPYYIEPRGLSAGDYKSVIDDCIKNRVDIIANLSENAEAVRKRAQQTADMAIKLIEG